MRIQYFSDLHLEHLKIRTMSAWIDSVMGVKAPVLLLCGDIGDPGHPSSYEDFLSHMSVRFQKVFLLRGNHECYNRTPSTADDCIHKICSRYPNISFLQNSFEDYGGYRFAGTTLWSHVSDPLHVNNDFYMIRDMSIDSHNRLHHDAKDFIRSTLATSPLPIIMMTHHLPSHRLTDPFYSRFSSYQQCYSSDCDDLIRFPIHSWFYGHTHRPRISIINGIRTFCNPIGYIGENSYADFERIVDLDLTPPCSSSPQS